MSDNYINSEDHLIYTKLEISCHVESDVNGRIRLILVYDNLPTIEVGNELLTRLQIPSQEIVKEVLVERLDNVKIIEEGGLNKTKSAQIIPIREVTTTRQ